MTSFADVRSQTFASLRNPNYRRYSQGQALSLIGTWMQTVAQSWLVLQLTGSATDVGFLVALQAAPVLLLGPYGGVVADRLDKRRLMMGLQTMMGVLALVLGVLTLTHVVAVWQVYVLAVLLGTNNAFENPARQAFVLEMVGPDDLRNAVSLNSVLVNVARSVGPAVAGLIIAAGGTGICFILNAVSFAAVVSSLARLDVARLNPSPPSARAKGQLSAGLAYVRRTPNLAVPLLMMALVGCLAFEFQVVLPILTKVSLHGGSAEYGFVTAAMGVGAVVGGLWVAARGKTGSESLIRTSMLFGVAMFAAAAAPNIATELVAILFVGAASVMFLSTGNSTLQLTAEPQMRGRVMALWAVAFLGSTPIGGPLAGLVSQELGPRFALVMGGLSCVVASAGASWALRPARRESDVPARTVVDPELAGS